MATITLDKNTTELIARLEQDNFKRQSDGRYRGNCPWRPGSNSGAFIVNLDENVSSPGWYDNVQKMGGGLKDLYTHYNIELPKPPQEQPTEYFYADAQGNPLFKVTRGVGKKFFQSHYCKQKADYVAGMGGNKNRCDCPKIPYSLYNLETIVHADADAIIAICEGEKDAETASQLGYIGTTNPGGAGNFHKISASAKAHLKGRRVVIFADNDDAGRKHAGDVANRLNGFADVIKQPIIFDGPKGYDLTDYVSGGATRADVETVINNQPAYESQVYDPTKAAEAGQAILNGQTPILTPQGIAEKQPAKVLSADDILTTDWPEPVWIVPGFLSAGLTILSGKPKLGKSWLVLQLCLSVGSGGQFLGVDVGQAKVLYLALEDTPQRLKKRMAMQGWTSGVDVDFVTMETFTKDIGDLRHGGGETIAALIKEKGYKLVIIDTFSRAVFSNQNDKDEMSQILSPLQVLAHSNDLALVVVDHMPKNAGETQDPIIDIYGSVGKGATLDTAWGLYRKRSKTEAVLAVDGRDIEGAKSISIKFDGELGCWQYQGDADAVKVTKRRSDMLEVLETDGPISVKDLADYLDIPKSNAYRDATELVKSGWAFKQEGDKKYLITAEGRRVIGLGV